MDDTVQQSQEPVVEAEIVAEPQLDSQVSAEDQSTVLTSLDELIKTHISSIDRLSEEKKKLGEMLADGFNNDASFKEASDKAKEAAKVKSQVKQQILNKPGVIEVANKLKNVNAEIKERQMSLSDYLLEYQRMTGVNQIEGQDGEVREIVHVAKLVKKASKDK
ncbi:MAG TPA: hypothetical protein VF820_04815 [Patescibacteria group bacterium]